MDYNNIQTRINLIYTSIDQQHSYHFEALDAMHTEITDKKITISFYNPATDESKVLNQIHTIISNLADIKDILKNKLEHRGDDPEVIENEINKSIYLQLILDLNNQKKHGRPLTKHRRSKKDPLIKNIGRSLGTSNKPDNIRVQRNDGSAIQNMMTSITADITDAQGNILYKLDELVEKSLKDWERIINKYNIT